MLKAVAVTTGCEVVKAFEILQALHRRLGPEAQVTACSSFDFASSSIQLAEHVLDPPAKQVPSQS